MSWTWRCQRADGSPAQDAGQAFPTRSDAESWLGESWRELAGRGVDAVTLLEGDREVYGPMSLRPPD